MFASPAAIALKVNVKLFSLVELLSEVKMLFSVPLTCCNLLESYVTE